MAALAGVTEESSAFYTPTAKEIATHGAEKLNVMYEGVNDLLRATAAGNLEHVRTCVGKVEQAYVLEERSAWFLWLTDALTTAAQYSREDVAAFLLDKDGADCGVLCPEGKCEEAFAAAAAAGGSAVSGSDIFAPTGVRRATSPPNDRVCGNHEDDARARDQAR